MVRMPIEPCEKQLMFNDKYHRIGRITPSLIEQVLQFNNSTKNFGEGSTAKTYCPVILLFVVSKVFEKLLNNRTVDKIDLTDLNMMQCSVSPH